MLPKYPELGDRGFEDAVKEWQAAHPMRSAAQEDWNKKLIGMVNSLRTQAQASNEAEATQPFRQLYKNYAQQASILDPCRPISGTSSLACGTQPLQKSLNPRLWGMKPASIWCRVR
jgi:hypothetical protein